MTDIAAPEVFLWAWLESRARDVFRLYGMREVRTPVLERLEVFTRALGEGTDVVQKEMYAFEDRGGRKIALRPEGTAGVIRYIGLDPQTNQDARVFYMGPMFRAERPQAGRKRQFHQLGVEAIGPASPAADAECIALLLHLFQAWGLDGFDVQVHTRGMPEDQSAVREGLLRELRPHTDRWCDECRRRMEAHPLRVLDCKNPACRAIVSTLPPVTSLMQESSRRHLQEVMAHLAALGIPARINPFLIRGLDYYVHTIWEITHPALGAQDALAGGGRYRMDMNGRVTEGVGFAIGLERVIMALQALNRVPPHLEQVLSAWLVSIGAAAHSANVALMQQWRHAGMACGMDLSGRSVKAQMRAADRSGAPWVVLRGDDELAQGVVVLKNMREGSEERLSAADAQARIRAASAPASA